jgi:hypothetical protein
LGGREANADVGACILPAAPPLQEAFSRHAPDHFRNCRSVNACRLDEIGLGWIVAVRDAQQHSELPRCQIGLINLLGEDFIGALRRAMQEMEDGIVNRRSIPCAPHHDNLQVGSPARTIDTTNDNWQAV